MYQLGWQPFCFQRTRGYGISRKFIVKQSPEELAVDAAWEKGEYGLCAECRDDEED
jgi:hypothetical protein